MIRARELRNELRSSVSFTSSVGRSELVRHGLHPCSASSPRVQSEFSRKRVIAYPLRTRTGQKSERVRPNTSLQFEFVSDSQVPSTIKAREGARPHCCTHLPPTDPVITTMSAVRASAAVAARSPLRQWKPLFPTFSTIDAAIMASVLTGDEAQSAMVLRQATVDVDQDLCDAAEDDAAEELCWLLDELMVQ
jgi:hypothetical protein